MCNKIKKDLNYWWICSICEQVSQKEIWNRFTDFLAFYFPLQTFFFHRIPKASGSSCVLSELLLHPCLLFPRIRSRKVPQRRFNGTQSRWKAFTCVIWDKWARFWNSHHHQGSLSRERSVWLKATCIILLSSLQELIILHCLINIITHSAKNCSNLCSLFGCTLKPKKKDKLWAAQQRFK